MNFAHIVGEHHHESFLSGLLHMAFSWAGLIIAIAVSLFVAVPIYMRTRKVTAKEKVDRK